MQVNVINPRTDSPPMPLEVDPGTDVGTLKSLIEVEMGIPVLRQVVRISGSDKELKDNDTLRGLGVQDQDLIAVEDKGGVVAPGGMHEEQLMEHARQDPRFMKMLDQKNPALAQAIRSRDMKTIKNELQKTMKSWNPFAGHNGDPRAGADPLSAEGQAYALERIRQQEIDANRAYAYEYMPEAFVDIHMLFIKCEVNGVPIMAFVDSGAQHTIMSEDCARRCNLERIIDKRYQGLAKGVGSARVIGRVHLAQLQCARSFFPASFTIIENQTMDCLLGLDLLRRHQCQIDLKKHVLRIGDHTEVPFMSEVEIRDHQEQTKSGSPQGIRAVPVVPYAAPPAPLAGPAAPVNTQRPTPPLQVKPLNQPHGTIPAVPNKPMPDSMYANNEAANLTASGDVTEPARPLASPSSQAARRRDELTVPNPADLHRSRRVHTQNMENLNYGGRMIMEEKAKQLVDLGFTKEKAMEALEKCKGDTELAAAMLFQSTGKF